MSRKPIINAAITEDTAADLEQLGIETDSMQRVKRADLKATDVVVCCRWSEGEPLLMPGNLIADCAWGCGHKVQHRPHVPAAPAKVCIPCVILRSSSEER